MPNLNAMSAAQDEISRIDKAIRLSTKFTDRQVFFETSEGRKLVTAAQLETMRTAAERRLLSARNE